ncbi:uncharacterized protein V1510DRAFT_419740 [Dipodascopsis tothii]|uniref:uncharacterized protein n=1 Tax=Dipodascopsis tothii TaxID=44089 RepID=UPI0034CD77E2
MQATGRRTRGPTRRGADPGADSRADICAPHARRRPASVGYKVRGAGRARGRSGGGRPCKLSVPGSPAFLRGGSLLTAEQRHPPRRARLGDPRARRLLGGRGGGLRRRRRAGSAGSGRRAIAVFLADISPQAVVAACAVRHKLAVYVAARADEVAADLATCPADVRLVSAGRVAVVGVAAHGRQRVKREQAGRCSSSGVEAEGV